MYSTSSLAKVGKIAKRLPSKITEISRDFGLFGTFKWTCYQLIWRWREWRLGLKTGEFDLGVAQAEVGDYVAYEPVDYLCFDLIIKHINIDPHESVFLDYGCGKGRALVLAGLQPFRKVIGVERSSALSDIARQHLNNTKHRLVTKECSVVTTNAMSYSVPTDVTHIFLYNPFTGQVLMKVLKQIKSSLQKKERKITIMYLLPAREDNKLDATKWLNKVQTLPTGFANHLKCYIHNN